MPPSTLRGRPVTTIYLHDDQGRVVRAVEQSRWTEGDRLLMLAYRRYLDSLCGGCGQPKDLAYHPDNDGWYEVPEPVQCHACTALKKAANSESKEPVEPVHMYRVLHERDYKERPLPTLDVVDDL